MLDAHSVQSFARLLFLSYVAVSVLFVTNLLFITPLSALFSLDSTSTSSRSAAGTHSWSGWWSTYGSSTSSNSKELLSLPIPRVKGSPDSLRGGHPINNDVLLFESSAYTLSSSRDTPLVHGSSPISIPESLYLSKLYSQALKPTRIVPFYYRASWGRESEKRESKRKEVTITTLVTPDRFGVLVKLAERYKGPISATVHVNSRLASSATTINDLLSTRLDILEELHELYTSHPSLATYVDIHLIYDAYDRQFNLWRNIARMFARTDYVMMLDVDFAVCTDFRRIVGGEVRSLVEGGRAALVVPAFEYTKHSEGVDHRTFPRDKKTLLRYIGAKRIEVFHSSWDPGHNSTDYERFYRALPGEMYKVTQYQSAYEPYVIFKKDGPPWCDERFVGYGANKAACLFEMYISGVDFYVLSDHFIIHQSHAYEELARRNERRHNRKLYAEFKEETCLEYLTTFKELGIFNTSREVNLIEQCKKVKEVGKVITQMMVNDGATTL